MDSSLDHKVRCGKRRMFALPNAHSYLPTEVVLDFCVDDEVGKGVTEVRRCARKVVLRASLYVNNTQQDPSGCSGALASDSTRLLT